MTDKTNPAATGIADRVPSKPEYSTNSARPLTTQVRQSGGDDGRIDFAQINRAALAAFPAVLSRILPGGKRVGAEIVVLNPRRADRHLGSFKVNRWTGRWADFSTGERGGDPVSLVAYLADVSQGEAARLLARMLGIEAGGPRHD